MRFYRINKYNKKYSLMCSRGKIILQFVKNSIVKIQVRKVA